MSTPPAGPVPTRAERAAAMDQFLAQAGWGDAARALLAGDASFRRYDRVQAPGRGAVLMDAPPPWEDVAPFLRVTEILHRFGLAAPQVLAAQREAGFLLLEDFGDDSFTRLLATQPAREGEVYASAVAVLVHLDRCSREQAPVMADLPAYDLPTYRREVALLAEWFLPQIVGMALARTLRDVWLSCWEDVLSNAALRAHSLVLRDYHADNLFWRPQHVDLARVGLLDYQDARRGDAAYDLVSLLEDARRDVAAETVHACLQQFIAASGEDAAAFATRYALLGAQRNAKIIGIFTRLAVRDGKPHYLRLLPRVWGHFLNDLRAPLLAPIARFVAQHVPSAARGVLQIDPAIGGMQP